MELVIFEGLKVNQSCHELNLLQISKGVVCFFHCCYSLWFNPLDKRHFIPAMESLVISVICGSSEVVLCKINNTKRREKWCNF